MKTPFTVLLFDHFSFFTESFSSCDSSFFRLIPFGVLFFHIVICCWIGVAAAIFLLDWCLHIIFIMFEGRFRNAILIDMLRYAWNRPWFYLVGYDFKAYSLISCEFSLFWIFQGLLCPIFTLLGSVFQWFLWVFAFLPNFSLFSHLSNLNSFFHNFSHFRPWI